MNTHFDAVYRRALSGTLDSWRRAEKSPRWRKLHGIEMRREDAVRNNPELTDCYHRGAIEASACLNLALGELFEFDISGTTEYTPDPYLRTQIAFLGESIVRAAQKRLSKDLIEMAALWGKANTLQQQSMLRTLVETLRSKNYFRRPKNKKINWRLDDFRSQKDDSRVLPKKYGCRSKSKPNCVGMAQLVCAFARLAGAKVYALMPYELTSLTLLRVRGKTQMAFAKLLNTTRSVKSQKLAKRYAKVGLRNIKKADYPIMLHGSMAVQLRDGDWYLVDPNFNTVTRLKRQSQFKREISRLELKSQALPSVSLLVENDQLGIEILAIQKHFQEICQIACELFELNRKRKLTMETILEILSQTKHLETVTKCFTAKMDASISGSIRLCLEDILFWLRGLIGHKCRTKARALSELSRVVVCKMFRGLEDLFTDLDRRVDDMPASFFELQSPEHFLACSVLAHIARNKGCSQPVEEVLTHETNNQFRLFYLVLPFLTGKLKPKDPRHLRVIEILKAYPARLLSLEKLLQKGSDRKESLWHARKRRKKEGPQRGRPEPKAKRLRRRAPRAIRKRPAAARG